MSQQTSQKWIPSQRFAWTLSQRKDSAGLNSQGIESTGSYLSIADKSETMSGLSNPSSSRNPDRAKSEFNVLNKNIGIVKTQIIELRNVAERNGTKQESITDGIQEVLSLLKEWTRTPPVSPEALEDLKGELRRDFNEVRATTQKHGTDVTIAVKDYGAKLISIMEKFNEQLQKIQDQGEGIRCDGQFIVDGLTELNRQNRIANNSLKEDLPIGIARASGSVTAAIVKPMLTHVLEATLGHIEDLQAFQENRFSDLMNTISSTSTKAKVSHEASVQCGPLATSNNQTQTSSPVLKKQKIDVAVNTSPVKEVPSRGTSDAITEKSPEIWRHRPDEDSAFEDLQSSHFEDIPRSGAPFLSSPQVTDLPPPLERSLSSDIFDDEDTSDNFSDTGNNDPAPGLEKSIWSDSSDVEDTPNNSTDCPITNQQPAFERSLYSDSSNSENISDSSSDYW